MDVSRGSVEQSLGALQMLSQSLGAKTRRSTQHGVISARVLAYYIQHLLFLENLLDVRIYKYVLDVGSIKGL